MNIQQIRECLLNLENETILNVSYQLGKRYGVLTIMAKDKDGIYFWEICKEPEDKTIFLPNERKTRTNRDAVKESLNRDISVFIKGIKIGEQVFSISSASGTCIGEDYNRQEQIQIISMLTKGARFGKLEKEPLSTLKMNCYHLEEQEFMPFTPEDKKIQVEFEEQHIPIKVNKRIKLSLGAYTKPRVIKIAGEEEITVYIHGVSLYPIWEKAEREFEEEKYKGRFTEAQILKIKKQYMEMLPSICPKGYVIPVIEYECDKDYQMKFYTLEYLRENYKNTSSAMLMHIKPEKEKGDMGFRNQCCALPAVEEGFCGKINTELFFYYKRIPSKIVNCKSI